MQPVVFEPENPVKTTLSATVDGSYISPITLQPIVRYSFRGISHLKWTWHLCSNRSSEPVRSESFRVIEGNKTTLNLGAAYSRIILLEKSRPKLGNSYHLSIRGILTADESWAEAGHTIVKQQFPIEFRFTERVQPVIRTPQRPSRQKLRVEEDFIAVNIYLNNNSDPLVVVSKQSGALITYAPDGRNLLDPVTGLAPNFTRASTDNDNGGMELNLKFLKLALVQELYGLFRGFSNFSYSSHWKSTGLHQDNPPQVFCTRIKTSQYEEEGDVDIGVSLSANASNGRKLFDVKVTYSVRCDARVKISTSVKPTRALRKLASLPRVGMKLRVVKELTDVMYYGRGPDENYPDRKSGSEMGVYSTSPAEMPYNQYIVPGENGSRSDCEWLSLRSSFGEGFCVASDFDGVSGDPFSCGVSLYSAEELHQATHTLPYRKNGESPIEICLDHQLMGLGGDTSWDPGVYPEFRVSPRTEYDYALWLMPLKHGDDAALLAKDL